MSHSYSPGNNTSSFTMPFNSTAAPQGTIALVLLLEETSEPSPWEAFIPHTMSLVKCIQFFYRQHTISRISTLPFHPTEGYSEGRGRGLQDVLENAMHDHHGCFERVYIWVWRAHTSAPYTCHPRVVNALHDNPYWLSFLGAEPISESDEQTFKQCRHHEDKQVWAFPYAPQYHYVLTGFSRVDPFMGRWLDLAPEGLLAAALVPAHSDGGRWRTPRQAGPMTHLSPPTPSASVCSSSPEIQAISRPENWVEQPRKRARSTAAPPAPPTAVAVSLSRSQRAPVPMQFSAPLAPDAYLQPIAGLSPTGSSPASSSAVPSPSTATTTPSPQLKARSTWAQRVSALPPSAMMRTPSPLSPRPADAAAPPPKKRKRAAAGDVAPAPAPKRRRAAAQGKQAEETQGAAMAGAGGLSSRAGAPQGASAKGKKRAREEDGGAGVPVGAAPAQKRQHVSPMRGRGPIAGASAQGTAVSGAPSPHAGSLLDTSSGAEWESAPAGPSMSLGPVGALDFDFLGGVFASPHDDDGTVPPPVFPIDCVPDVCGNVTWGNSTGAVVGADNGSCQDLLEALFDDSHYYD